jgi:hypothetical protein
MGKHEYKSALDILIDYSNGLGVIDDLLIGDCQAAMALINESQLSRAIRLIEYNVVGELVGREYQTMREFVDNPVRVGC